MKNRHSLNFQSKKKKKKKKKNVKKKKNLQYQLPKSTSVLAAFCFSSMVKQNQKFIHLSFPNMLSSKMNSPNLPEKVSVFFFVGNLWVLSFFMPNMKSLGQFSNFWIVPISFPFSLLSINLQVSVTFLFSLWEVYIQFVCKSSCLTSTFATSVAFIPYLLTMVKGAWRQLEFIII